MENSAVKKAKVGSIWRDVPKYTRAKLAGVVFPEQTFALIGKQACPLYPGQETG